MSFDMIFREKKLKITIDMVGKMCYNLKTY